MELNLHVGFDFQSKLATAFCSAFDGLKKKQKTISLQSFFFFLLQNETVILNVAIRDSQPDISLTATKWDQVGYYIQSVFDNTACNCDKSSKITHLLFT